MAGDSLETYLRDHHAGATGGLALIERLVDGSEGEAERADLAAIRDQISGERPALEEIMESAGASPSTVKDAGARVGEWFSHPKLHSDAPEARVLQLEGMIMGVTGKLQLWRTLIGLCDAGDDRFDREQLEGLRAEAEEQRLRLEQIHGATDL